MPQTHGPILPTGGTSVSFPAREAPSTIHLSGGNVRVSWRDSRDFSYPLFAGQSFALPEETPVWFFWESGVPSLLQVEEEEYTFPEAMEAALQAAEDFRRLAPNVRKNTFDAARAPLPTDDTGAGYAVGSRWLWQGQEWVAAGVATGAARWLRTGDLTPQMFGAVGDGVADDTGAVQAWADAGGTQLPAGRWRLSRSLTFTRPVSVTGAGMGATILYWPSDAASAGISVVSGANKAPTTIQGISLLTGANGAGTALLIDYSGNAISGVVQPRTSPRVRLRDVQMAGGGSVMNSGWLHHADIIDGLGVHVSGCAVEGRGTDGSIVSQTGYRLRGGGAPVEFTLDGCWAYQVGDAVATDNAEGVIVTASNFVAVNRGIAFTGTGVEPQCNLSDSHINAYVACVDLDQCAQANIHDNLLYSRNEIASEVLGVRLTATSQNCRVSRNTFVRTGTSTMRAVQVSGPDHVIEGNLFQGVTVGIDILAGALRPVERDNRYVGTVGTRIMDASTTLLRGTTDTAYVGSMNALAGSAAGVTTAFLAPGASGLPSGVNPGGAVVTTTVWDANAAYQHLLALTTDISFVRRKSGGTWGAWQRVSVLPAGGASDLSGTGTPEGAITAPVGSTYRRTDGGAGTTFYVKESGTGNTGWVAK